MNEMSEQLFVLSMLALFLLDACLAECSHRKKYGRSRLFSPYGLIVGSLAVSLFMYFGTFPLASAGEAQREVVTVPAPITNSVVGIQNISIEDPLIRKMRELSLVVSEAYRNDGPRPDDAIASNTDSKGNIVPAYWRLK